MPQGIRAWAIWGAAQVLLTLALKLVIKLVDNAVIGWGDDRLAELLGVTSPSATTVFNWTIPFALAALALWLVHYFIARPLKEELAKISEGNHFSAISAADRLQAWMRRVEPYHVIFLGLAIALGGVVWQTQRGQPKRSDQPMSHDSPATTHTSPAQLPLSSSPRKTITGYDLQIRQKALDEIYDCIHSKIDPAYDTQNKLNITWDKETRDSGPKSLARKLAASRDQINTAFAELDAILKKYGSLKDVQDLTDWTFTPIIAQTGVFADLLNRLPDAPADMTGFIESHEAFKNWRQAVSLFAQWARSKKEVISKQRDDYNSFEIIPGSREQDASASEIVKIKQALEEKTNELEKAKTASPAIPPRDSARSSILREGGYLKDEKEDLGQKLRTISTSIHTMGDEILKKSEIALNHSYWERADTDIAPEIQRMDDIRNLTVEMHKALYDGLIDKEREFRVELNGVLFPKEPFTEFQIGANEFHNGLTAWMKMRDAADNSGRNDLLRLVQGSRMTFGVSRDRFAAWLSQRLEIIEQARRELK
ncbi:MULTISPECIES: hypothetical protein [Bradyrhizobium]|jgi:hypothetical protein|nr:hypothetical protein [Bradyrhizobium japonicum]